MGCGGGGGGGADRGQVYYMHCMLGRIEWEGFTGVVVANSESQYLVYSLGGGGGMKTMI